MSKMWKSESKLECIHPGTRISRTFELYLTVIDTTIETPQKSPINFDQIFHQITLNFGTILHRITPKLILTTTRSNSAPKYFTLQGQRYPIYVSLVSLCPNFYSDLL